MPTEMLFFSVSTCKHMEKLSMLELAFLGDAIHTVFVRRNLLKLNNQRLDILNKEASKLCSAKNQSKVLEKLLPALNEEECDIVRRARNSKAKHSAKNASSADYHKATAFEALVGWLYVNKNEKRLNEILELSVFQEE